ncbi:MAG: sigma factor-like helix-turn-helix DNA-binding protein, partial [Acidimicrobiia bacterium]
AAVVAPYDVDPDDVLHSVLVTVLRGRSLHTLDDPASYVRRSIVNHVHSELRRRGRARTALGRLGRAEASVDEYPSDLAELSRLAPDDRAILYLHDVEQFTFEEVADLLDTTAGRARMRASRARRKLEKALRQEETR